jgi:twitching motility protein PilT
MDPPELQRMMYTILTQKQREKFEEHLELDFAYALPGRARFRVNIYRQRDALGARLPLIPFEIKKLEDTRRPDVDRDFAMLPRGCRPRDRTDRLGQVDDARGVVDLANRTRQDTS